MFESQDRSPLRSPKNVQRAHCSVKRVLAATSVELDSEKIARMYEKTAQALLGAEVSTAILKFDTCYVIPHISIVHPFCLCKGAENLYRSKLVRDRYEARRRVPPGDTAQPSALPFIVFCAQYRQFIVLLFRTLSRPTASAQPSYGHSPKSARLSKAARRHSVLVVFQQRRLPNCLAGTVQHPLC